MELGSKDQSLFELIKIFRDKISNFDTNRFGKSLQKASELRKQGNDFYAKHEYEQAIETYTDVRISASLVHSLATNTWSTHAD